LCEWRGHNLQKKEKAPDFPPDPSSQGRREIVAKRERAENYSAEESLLCVDEGGKKTIYLLERRVSDQGEKIFMELHPLPSEGKRGPHIDEKNCPLSGNKRKRVRRMDSKRGGGRPAKAAAVFVFEKKGFAIEEVLTEKGRWLDGGGLFLEGRQRDAYM